MGFIYLRGSYFIEIPNSTGPVLRSPIKPKKSLGQHFLTDIGVIQEILQGIQAKAEDLVIEIGPGTGALTQGLVQRYKRLIAIEIDERAIKELHKRYPALDIRHADVLNPAWLTWIPPDEKALIVGNLPYYITSPILFLLIDHRERFEEAIIMIQKEVADRLLAKPNTKAYGILSVQVQLAASVEKIVEVPPSAFSPPPKVESTVLRLRFDQPRPNVDPEHLRKVIRQAFSQKRKMLRNTLGPWLSHRELAGWDLTRRAETLSTQEFVQLARDLAAYTPPEA